MSTPRLEVRRIDRDRIAADREDARERVFARVWRRSCSWNRCIADRRRRSILWRRDESRRLVLRHTCAKHGAAQRKEHNVRDVNSDFENRGWHRDPRETETREGGSIARPTRIASVSDTLCTPTNASHAPMRIPQPRPTTETQSQDSQPKWKAETESRNLQPKPTAEIYSLVRIAQRSGKSGLKSVVRKYAAPGLPPVPCLKPIVRSTIFTWR